MSPYLSPSTEVATYAATLTWELYTPDDYQCSTIEKELTLRKQRCANGYVAEFCTKPPRLTKQENLEDLEQVALRLAKLYEQVVVQTTSTGELIALLNHAALNQTWVRLAQELRAATTADDQVTATLLAFLERQVQHPDSLLQSLANDYLYQALLRDFDERQPGQPAAPAQQRAFANFFDKQTLFFGEEVTTTPAEAAGQLHVELRGIVDVQKTDVAGIEALIGQALRGARVAVEASPPGTRPAPGFSYKATHVLDQATKLPLRVALTLAVRLGQLYNKEYNLSVIRL